MDDASQPNAAKPMRRSAEVTIRPMATGDAAMVAQMARELAAAVDDPEPVLGALDLLRDGTGPDRWFDCLVAVVDESVVGYAMFCRGYEAHIGKRRLWLSDLYVQSQARRIGVGRALMHAVMRIAAMQDCEAVYWDLWRENRVGKGFYESLGAVESGDLAIWHVASGTSRAEI
jgi:GNAT superfamily N-acetyltransferase